MPRDLSQPLAKVPHGFTLVELLVVIAIISVLAALLLPALEDALEMGRRTSCANTVRQQFLAAHIYAGDWNNFLPRPGKWGTDPSIDTNAYCATYNMRVYEGGTWNNAKRYDTAWYIIIKQLQLLPLPAARCANMDFTPASPGKLHYSYLYNSLRSCGGESIYAKRDTAEVQRLPLFWDAAGYRLLSVKPVVARQRTTGSMEMKWAHAEGGNVARHNGQVAWLPNMDRATVTTACWPAVGSGLRFTDANVRAYLKGD